MMSAQDIMQALFALQTLQYSLKQVPDDLELEAKVRTLESHLRSEIQAWGGLEMISRWLLENDPGHGKPEELQGMDWSWLESNE